MHRLTGVLHAVALLGLIAAGSADAQSYPARAVRVIIPFAPGGGTDNLTRDRVPGCEFIVYHGFQHNITDAVPERCAEELRRFLMALPTS